MGFLWDLVQHSQIHRVGRPRVERPYDELAWRRRRRYDYVDRPGSRRAAPRHSSKLRSVVV